MLHVADQTSQTMLFHSPSHQFMYVSIPSELRACYNTLRHQIQAQMSVAKGDVQANRKKSKIPKLPKVDTSK